MEYMYMVFFGSSRMQIRKKWLNQLKNFFNKHFKEYYLASFCWWIPSSCENHCTLTCILCIPPGYATARKTPFQMLESSESIKEQK